jgi:hypothetical protein
MADETQLSQRQLETLPLQDLFQMAFREGRGEDIRQALMKRLKIRRRDAKGEGQVGSRADISNALTGTIEGEAAAALFESRQREKRKNLGGNLAFQQAEIGDPVTRRKAEPFSVFDTAFRILKRKNQALNP